MIILLGAGIALYALYKEIAVVKKDLKSLKISSMDKAPLWRALEESEQELVVPMDLVDTFNDNDNDNDFDIVPIVTSPEKKRVSKKKKIVEEAVDITLTSLEEV